MQHQASHYGNLIAEIAYQSLLSSRVRLPSKLASCRLHAYKRRTGQVGLWRDIVAGSCISDLFEGASRIRNGDAQP